MLYDSFGGTSVVPFEDTYLTKLYKSSFLSVDSLSIASTSETIIRFLFALVTATLVISELFFIQSKVFLLVLGEIDVDIIIVFFSAPWT